MRRRSYPPFENFVISYPLLIAKRNIVYINHHQVRLCLFSVLPSSSMELDELIPVDQFFEDYVSRLQRSAFGEDLNPYEVGGVHRRPSHIPIDAITSPEQKPPATAGQYGSTSGLPMNTYTSFMEPPPSQAFVNADGGGSVSQPGGMMLDPSYFGERPRMEQTTPFTSSEVMQQYPNVPFGSTTSEGLPFSSPYADQQMFGTVGESTDTSGGSTKKGRQKSVRQQQLNKLAQQRYRERKKARTVGLQQTVDTLTDEVNRLNIIKEEKKKLEEKNLTLERQLIEKEAELQSLRVQVEEANGKAGNNTTEVIALPNEERSSQTVGLDSRPAKLFHKKVKDLQKYLKNNRLDPSLLVNPLDDSIPKKVVDDIYHLVGDVCMTCMQLTRHDGPDLWDLITASLDSKQRESHDRVMWRSIAESLKLGRDQIVSALTLREHHLAKLEKIFVQRQTLNLEAIQHLLPSDQGGRAPVATPLGCFNLATFVQRLRHTAKLNTVLDRLKDNLSKEQKANSELEYMTFYRVMSPLQGAWFTVSAYPHQCDCLEFLNAIKDLYGSLKSEGSASIMED